MTAPGVNASAIAKAAPYAPFIQLCETRFVAIADPPYRSLTSSYRCSLTAWTAYSARIGNSIAALAGRFSP
jgi:hypothetical protein